MGRVSGGDLKDGLQLRLMDPSTGKPYSAWYKFKGSEIVEIQDAGICVEIKILRRVRAESSRRPPRHRRDACSMAWRCRFLTARLNQRGHVIAEK